MDVNIAFLHGILQEELFLNQPIGFESEEFPNHVYCLDKAVHGLKRAPRAWYDTLANYLLKFGFSNSKPAKTLMSSSVSIATNATGVDVNANLYRGIMGSLLYLISSHLDILFATILCAHYQSSSKESHFLVVKWIFRYIKHTLNLGLWYPHDSELKLVGYTHSDNGGCGIDCKSTSGGAPMLGDRLVSWSSKKQTSMACSIAEVEYVAIGRCCSYILWVQN
ncbi:secreted RxLR effector protein 161-like [Lactuca sativa]|uniref:secreted RxLR effector protein 161-like n=1 Tax=Lactuca sativa TaxID=4236 RepID=UPI000CD82103|nr:secreted RxLR effector protein 161-like [Lactuca sativa]